MHLFEHPDAGFYAADSLDEAKDLLLKDTGDSDCLRDMTAVRDERQITVHDADGPYERVPEPNGTHRIRYLDKETKTAKQWADIATHKGTNSVAMRKDEGPWQLASNS